MKRNDVPAYTLTATELQQLVIDAVRQANISNEQKQNDLELLSLRQVQQIFKKSRSTIFSWKKQRILTPIYVSGSLYFRKSDIEKIINQAK